MPFFVFDREGTDHPWERAFGEAVAGPYESRHAVAANWRMDHRVSQERETEDLLGSGCFTANCKANDWFSSLFLYHRKRICLPSDPARDPRSAYLEAWNDANRIDSVMPFDRLCHVGSLRMITKRVVEGIAAADTREELFDTVGVVLPEKPPRARGSSWLVDAVDQFARNLTKRGEETVRTATRILLTALGPNEPPWWACFAEEVASQIEAGSAIGLCEALGLGHLKARDWLIVWHYPAEVAGALYRPTVAEAAECPFHYPSPPDNPFGITMPLNPAFGTCREVLHRPLRDEAAEASCTGKLLLLDNFPSMPDTRILEVRRLHRDRLRLEITDKTQKAWHDRHEEP